MKFQIKHLMYLMYYVAIVSIVCPFKMEFFTRLFEFWGLLVPIVDFHNFEFEDTMAWKRHMRGDHIETGWGVVGAVFGLILGGVTIFFVIVAPFVAPRFFKWIDHATRRQ